MYGFLCDEVPEELPNVISSDPNVTLGRDQAIHCVIINIIPEGESDREEDPEDIQTVVLNVELQLNTLTGDFKKDLLEFLKAHLYSSRCSDKIYDLRIIED